jgi:hypothetical protein
MTAINPIANIVDVAGSGTAGLACKAANWITLP